jgi:anti-sigma regulatory factor (Ser/Thr protein kinase)/anti-anti-sigma regulatory factor
MKNKPVAVENKEVPGSEKAKIIHFSGDLTSDCVEQISLNFKQLPPQKALFIIAEMSAVTMISSAVLGEFMGCRKRLLEEGGDLVFSGFKLDIRTKLNLMGATKIFRFYCDIRAALTAYKWEIERKPEKIYIQFPPYLKIVPPLRQLISRIARQKGYGNRDSFRIETIVDEICNNAVEHGKNAPGEMIDLAVTIDPDKIEIDVRNISDPEKLETLTALLVPNKDSDKKTKVDVKRGRGLTLIKMLCDELSVDSTEQGTSVHVKKVREE